MFCLCFYLEFSKDSGPAEMLQSLKLILLQSVTLVLLSPASEAVSLGLTVHVVPLESDGGKTVGPNSLVDNVLYTSTVFVWSEVAVIKHHVICC